MKKLIILRHSKSSWNNAGQSDYDRELTTKGEKIALSMGDFLEAKNGKPELIVTSSANRALHTAKIVATQLEYPIEDIKQTRSLYLSCVNELLTTITTLPNDIDSCILVGHNPGLTELINHWGIRLDNLPTASVVCFEFDTNEWNNISKENAEMKWFQIARDL